MDKRHSSRYSSLKRLAILSIIGFIIAFLSPNGFVRLHSSAEADPEIAITLSQVDNIKGLGGKIGKVEQVSKSDFIILCNLVGREYGGDKVAEKEKAKVVECVFNRLHSNEFPNTVTEVIRQDKQFEGYLSKYSYSDKVTESVRKAVLNYLNGSYKKHNYFYYWGDLKRNYFYDNYITFEKEYNKYCTNKKS